MSTSESHPCRGSDCNRSVLEAAPLGFLAITSSWRKSQAKRRRPNATAELHERQHWMKQFGRRSQSRSDCIGGIVSPSNHPHPESHQFETGDFSTFQSFSIPSFSSHFGYSSPRAQWLGAFVDDVPGIVCSFPNCFRFEIFMVYPVCSQFST